MTSLSRLALALASFVAFPATTAFAEDEPRSETEWRLFVGDHAEGVVRAFDAETGTHAGTFRIDKTPSLTRSDSGRTVFAVQGDAGKVAAIATGIALDDHGEHADLKVTDSTLLPTVLTGTKPAHIVEGSGSIALFDDGTGDVTLFRESELLDGKLQPQVLKPGGAHHGLAAPMGDFLVVSVPGSDPEKPRVGLKVIDREGKQVGETVACPGVHGQAQSARTFVFGCKDGIVVAAPAKAIGGSVLTHVSTADLGEGNVSTVKGGKAMQFFLGNYGPSAVVLIEPGASEMFRKIDLPTRRVDFALDPAKAANAYILTEDGNLHLLDVLSGKIVKSARVTESYSMDGHWRDPRPRLAVAGDHIALTDPRHGLVRMISTETLAEDRTIPVEGIPYTIVAVGGSGAVH
ncbi:metallochaperone AztD [Aureimonas pseudogalii]|uniref:Uncharacterized protein n=1 Tax=Aureimonas pseudogalii TaxID=1744844 RepID=A0A7W6H927_9HYPH|nr:metallochaperone AztD [Aureimonas pseudogalii]MBB4000676.1 hypothetical protein [Aureimonas pseudogalii]